MITASEVGIMMMDRLEIGTGTVQAVSRFAATLLYKVLSTLGGANV